MKVIHIAYSDRIGGASIAAYRQHEALRMNGIDSQMSVLVKKTDDSSVSVYKPNSLLSHRINRKLRREYLNSSKRYWGNPNIQDSRSCYLGDLGIKEDKYDVINLQYWSGFIDLDSFSRKINKNIPIVVTMHDMSAFTGGCGYTGDCSKYTHECNQCPLVTRKSINDLSNIGFNNKKSSYKLLNDKRIVFIADSYWLASKASESKLLQNHRIETIHYGINLNTFKPLDKKICRAALNLPLDVKILSFAANQVDNPRKGIEYLKKALSGIENPPLLLSWGKGYPSILKNFKHVHLGNIESEKILALAYSAADFTVVPSTEEAFGQTALESIACARPVIAFNAGGLPETVIDGRTGLLAENKDSIGLAKAINVFMECNKLLFEYGENGRNLAELEYSYIVNASSYARLYNSIVKNK